ncbi:hypothetical protein GN956_G24323 [Arapaima gigas]
MRRCAVQFWLQCNCGNDSLLAQVGASAVPRERARTRPRRASPLPLPPNHAPLAGCRRARSRRSGVIDGWRQTEPSDAHSHRAELSRTEPRAPPTPPTVQAEDPARGVLVLEPSRGPQWATNSSP